VVAATFVRLRPDALACAQRWFIAVLRDQLLLRRAAIAALEGLAAYESGPGHGHGLREYWRKRDESEQAGR
jgi:hypothetical protein